MEDANSGDKENFLQHHEHGQEAEIYLILD
jgi:hypothetical protein